MLFLDLDCFQLKRRVIFSLQVVVAQIELVNIECVGIADVAAVAVRIEDDSIVVMVDDGTTVFARDDAGIVAGAKGNNLHYELVHCHCHSVRVWYC